MSRKHFAVVRHFLRNTEWDFFQFVEIGLDRMQHGFWASTTPGTSATSPETPTSTPSPIITATSMPNWAACWSC